MAAAGNIQRHAVRDGSWLGNWYTPWGLSKSCSESILRVHVAPVAHVQRCTDRKLHCCIVVSVVVDKVTDSYRACWSIAHRNLRLGMTRPESRLTRQAVPDAVARFRVVQIGKVHATRNLPTHVRLPDPGHDRRLHDAMSTTSSR